MEALRPRSAATPSEALGKKGGWVAWEAHLLKDFDRDFPCASISTIQQPPPRGPFLKGDIDSFVGWCLEGLSDISGAPAHALPIVEHSPDCAMRSSHRCSARHLRWALHSESPKSAVFGVRIGALDEVVFKRRQGPGDGLPW